jgi:hypothetical protein
MDQREQDGGVGIGTDRNPLRRGCFRAVFTNRTDADDLDAALASSTIQPPAECSPQPPFATCRFLGLAPPNSTRSSAWRAIDDHDVSGPVTACAEPSTCGKKVRAAPKL